MIASRTNLRSMTSITAVATNRRNLYLAVFVGNLLALITGIQLAWTAPLLRALKDPQLEHNPLGRIMTVSECSWFGSLLPMGAIFGSYAAGYLLDQIGRKPSLIISCAFPFLVSYLMITSAKSLALFWISRILAGFGVASVFTILPLYNQEISEVSNRGLVSASIMPFETAGRMYAYGIAPYTSISKFCLFSAILQFGAIILILRFLPESPYYLVRINKLDAAEKVLTFLRLTTGEEVIQELNLIKEIDEESKENKNSFRDILSYKASRKAFVITLSLAVFQNFSGVLPITLYSPMIFDELTTEIPIEITSLIMGCVHFLASLVAPYFVDKLGRRWMLFMSACGMCISEILLGLHFFNHDKGFDSDDTHWLPIVWLITCMISYVIGFGPLVWTVMAEIFPENMKSAAITVTVSVWWTLAFLLNKFFPFFRDKIGMAACFWIFATNCFSAAVFVFFYLIETKGKNFLEIQALLNK